MTKLNWTRGGGGHKDSESRKHEPDVPSSTSNGDELLSVFGVNRVNDVNFSGDDDIKNNNNNTSNTGVVSNVEYLTHNNNNNDNNNNNTSNQKSQQSVLTERAGDVISTPQPQVLVRDYIPNVHVTKVNCAKIIAGDSAELSLAKKYQSTHPKLEVPAEYFTTKAKNCQSFIQSRRYTTKPLSTEEAEFSLAYSLVIFKEIELVERLLRAIYRPQNYYCIHVDVKASSSFKSAVTAIADCFDNVFLSSRSVDVQWGYYSVLEPELVCMEDLWKYKKWK